MCSGAKRRNIPTAEFQSVLEKEQQAPKKLRYPRNTDLDPQLVWRGKDEQDWSDLVVHAPPLYIQEKVHPKALIDDLLNFARLSRVELQTLDVDPRDLVERARTELASDTSGRAITWEVTPLPSVRADPALLYQVLFNLLANAVKYTRKCEAARIEV